MTRPKRRKDDFDVSISHYQSTAAGGFVTSNKMLENGVYRAVETVSGGAVLRALGGADDDGLACVRFAESVFAVLKTHRRKGESVRETLERIILSSLPEPGRLAGAVRPVRPRRPGG